MRVGGEIQVQHETKFQMTKQNVAPDSTISVNWETKQAKNKFSGVSFQSERDGFHVRCRQRFFFFQMKRVACGRWREGAAIQQAKSLLN